MTRTALATIAASLAALLAVSPVRAHHIWLEADESGARLYFGEFNENLRERSPGLLDRLEGVSAAVSDKEIPVQKGGTYFTVGDKTGSAQGITVQVKGAPVAERKSGTELVRTAWMPAARYVPNLTPLQPSLPLDIVPGSQPGEFAVSYKGRPLSKHKVEVSVPSGWSRTLTTDDAGRISFSMPWNGWYAIELRHTDRTPGQHGGAAYDVLSLVTTLTFQHNAGTMPPPSLPPHAPTK